MSDTREQIIEAKRRQAGKVFKPSGPMTGDESALRQEAEEIVIETIIASAVYFSNQGVPQDYAFYLIFGSFNDETLRKILKEAWRCARAKRMNK